MATEALQRLNNNLFERKFTEFVQTIYPEIDAAIEEVTSDKLTLILLTEKTIEIVTSPQQNKATVEVEIESIPIKEIRKILKQYDEYSLDPDDPIEIKEHLFKVTIFFASREDLVIDLTDVRSRVRYKIKDVNDLVDKLKKSL